jgi:hypothetical protein
MRCVLRLIFIALGSAIDTGAIHSCAATFASFPICYFNTASRKRTSTRDASGMPDGKCFNSEECDTK